MFEKASIEIVEPIDFEYSNSCESLPFYEKKDDNFEILSNCEYFRAGILFR